MVGKFDFIYNFIKHYINNIYNGSNKFILAACLKFSKVTGLKPAYELRRVI